MEALLTINHEAILQGEVKRVTQDRVSLSSLGVDHTTRHKDIHHGSCLFQSTSLQHEVLQGLVGRIAIDARILHLTMDGDGLLLLYILTRGHEEHILILQDDITGSTLHDAGQVHWHHLEGAVLLHAVHHGMGRKGLLSDALTVLHQALHAGNLTAQLIHTRTEHSTLYLHHVLIAVQHRVHQYRVTVSNLK